MKTPKIPMARLAHAVKVSLKDWTLPASDDDLIDAHHKTRDAVDAAFEQLEESFRGAVLKAASEAIEHALTEPAHAWFPADREHPPEFGPSEDGIGGPLPTQPLRVYVALPLGPDEDNNPTWSFDLSELVDDSIDWHCGRDGKIDPAVSPGVVRVADALRALSAKLDAALGKKT